jgi:hypothetical protein
MGLGGKSWVFVWDRLRLENGEKIATATGRDAVPGDLFADTLERLAQS